MICHVCRASASGQCRGCLKFYCPAHGDGLCAPCALNPRTSATHQCFRCGEQTAGTCDDCGKPFCNRHGASYPKPLGFERRLKCFRCRGAEYVFWLVVSAFFVPSVALVLFYLMTQNR